MTRLLLLFILFFLSISLYAKEECDEINAKSESSQSYVDGEQSGYIVSGSGRLYFYDAPDEKCINKKIFLIKGDLVNVYAEFNGFSSVMYFKKNGETVEGWLKSQILLPTGTGIGPKK
ncbi:hypothetical protein SJI19_06480 [Acerihabitans sp. TG2]|uniref:hypothetical protein n=1 Tax=Acerihabitans sp. TG2 TaxID=3096008 RepID=UPI002B22DA37|nr:hypothetical protein [Acerihabitans sp. TG2]MEA9390197.1 hypothetical protein [Acerihabitans sp. TG2]